MNFKKTRMKSAAGVAALALLAVPLAACSDEDGGSDVDRVDAVATVDDLANGKNTQITLDDGFLQALEGLGLTPAPTRDATLDGAVIQFPITGGNVSLFEPGSVPNYVVGQVQHENSGLSLTAGDTTVEIGNFNVDPGVSRVYGDVAVNGQLAATSAYLFRLNGNTLKEPQTEGNDVILEGTRVFISDVAAGLLNDTFGTDAVTDELLVGVAKITVNAGG